MSPIRYTIQERQQLPADLDWLTLSERRRHDGFRFAKRRGDWLLGRWGLLERAGQTGGGELERVESDRDGDLGRGRGGGDESEEGAHRLHFD